MVALSSAVEINLGPIYWLILFQNVVSTHWLCWIEGEYQVLGCSWIPKGLQV